MDKNIKIIIVDDNKQFVEGLELLLSKYSTFEIVGTAYNGIELLNHPALGFANIILLDIEMPGLNGFEIAKKINHKFNYIKLIAITMYQEKAYLQELINVGFVGFVHKSEITTELIGVIEGVSNDQYKFPRNIIFP